MSEIVDYLRLKGIKVRKHGQYYKSRCPFPKHKDQDPSFTIYDKTESFYCWGCGEWGDVDDLRVLFGEKALRKHKNRVELTRNELLDLLYKEKTKRVYSVIKRIRSMRSKTNNQERLNKLVMAILNKHTEDQTLG